MPDVLKAVGAGETVVIAEGEKDVGALVQNGFCATCNPGGAGKWSDDFTASLAGADVVILPDNDEPGRRHAQLVAFRLHGKAKRVRVITLPNVPNKLGLPIKDSHDFFHAGGTARHPDYAKFAVRLGRALNREAQTIAALQAAELDKAQFCLENDNIGAALLTYLKGAWKFNGTAAELAPKLVEIDPELADKLTNKFSAKRLSKRLGMLWPHLQKRLHVANREDDRNGVNHYTFQT